MSVKTGMFRTFLLQTRQDGAIRTHKSSIEAASLGLLPGDCFGKLWNAFDATPPHVCPPMDASRSEDKKCFRIK